MKERLRYGDMKVENKQLLHYCLGFTNDKAKAIAVELKKNKWLIFISNNKNWCHGRGVNAEYC